MKNLHSPYPKRNPKTIMERTGQIVLSFSNNNKRLCLTLKIEQQQDSSCVISDKDIPSCEQYKHNPNTLHQNIKLKLAKKLSTKTLLKNKCNRV